MRKEVLVTVLLVLLLSKAGVAEQHAPAASDVCQPSSPEGRCVSTEHAQAAAAKHFPEIVDATALKDTIDPCTDFYQFACGSWLDSTTIPADKKSVSRLGTPLADATDKTLNRVLAAYAAGNFTPSSTYESKIADYYKSCMDSDKQTSAALTMLQEEIHRISQAKTPEDLARLTARLQLSGASAFFSFGSAQDLDDATRVIGDAAQGGMGLPDRDYYLKQDPKSLEILKKYKQYIGRLFRLLGESRESSEKIARSVLKIETSLAQSAYAIAKKEDPSQIHHPLGIAGLKKLAPHFDWDTYFQELGIAPTTAINVEEPEFFARLDRLLVDTSQEDLGHYLVWQIVDRAAPQMGNEYKKEHFQFWEAYLNGKKRMLPRWKECTQAVEHSLSYALAEAYVKLFDGAAIKAKTENMIVRIKNAFSDDLRALATGPDGWMDESTRNAAIEKIRMVAQKVGAPEKWRNYESLSTAPASYLSNDLNVSRFEGLRDLAKIGKPVDKLEWQMAPWEVNAYYDRSNNEFNFPFGILQPPSLDLTASDGANYGAFGGGTIGHELTHGFDNNGSQYDAHGNLKNWWSEKTKEQFSARTQCYIDQADHYRIEEVGLNVNGSQTLEENLADQGGVKLGYVALDKILSSRPEGPRWLGKYSERQQYWVAYAQSWCTKSTPESLRVQLTTDVHPPAEFRVNAVLRNRPEFAHDFGCKAGTQMAPADRCALW